MARPRELAVSRCYLRLHLSAIGPKKLTMPITDDQVGHTGHGHEEEQEEYAALLDYVAKFQNRKGTGGQQGDGSYEKKKRSWIPPFKTRIVKYDRNGEEIAGETAIQTPEDWYDLSMLKI